MGAGSFPMLTTTFSREGAIMKRLIVVLSVWVLFASVSIAQAAIGNFIADSNQFGYTGTVQNITKGTGPWTFNDTTQGEYRDASVFYAKGATVASGYSPYNDWSQILTNWSQHSPSNQNPGFFQLADIYGVTVTSSSGGWTQEVGGLWDFTFTISGLNAPYPWSRAWQPDQNMAWGVTFDTYTYTMTATGMTTTVAADGWRYNTTNPTGITGSFDGTFTSTNDVNKNPITDGDTYQVNLVLDKTLWDSTGWSDTDVYGTYYGQYSTFGAAVPEPAALVVWSLLGTLAIMVGLRRRRPA
jgi:hypothetical protein